MNASRRTGLTWGVVLILVGVVLFAFQAFPNLWPWMNNFTWPWFVIGAGVLLLIIGVLTNAPGMAVPASIVGGIGGILYWQNATGDWASWAWIWALIPGFAGVGTILMGLWQGKLSEVLAGLGTVVVSAVLTVLFASFLGGPRLLGDYWRYWPVLLILLGLISLVQWSLRARARSEVIPPSAPSAGAVSDAKPE